jgi:hypothetical protein
VGEAKESPQVPDEDEEHRAPRKSPRETCLPPPPAV